jgi:hypothetical protein
MSKHSIKEAAWAAVIHVRTIISYFREPLPLVTWFLLLHPLGPGRESTLPWGDSGSNKIAEIFIYLFILFFTSFFSLFII